MRYLFAVLLCCETLVLSGRLRAAENPVKVIFDTDMDTDCDDAGAMAVLHTLANRGEVEILATVVSSKYDWSVPTVAAINKYYGHPEIPIGCPKGEGAPVNRGSAYAKTIAQEFPTDYRTNADAPNAVEVYRKILAAQPDGSVVVVTVGYATNLADLLSSSADEHSPLNGTDLVAKKVKFWSCMGGRYPRHLDPGVFGNFKPDPKAIVKAAEAWPTTIYFSGIGEEVLTGSRLNETPENNPVRRIYKLYLKNATTRPSWDQVALLYAVRPDATFWRLDRTGYNHIFPNGTNEWRDDPDSDRQVLVELAPGMAKPLTETIDELMVAAPQPQQ